MSQLFELRPCPVRVLKSDIGHRQDEAVAVVEGYESVGFLHGDGRIKVFPIKKEYISQKRQQLRRLGVALDFLGQG